MSYWLGTIFGALLSVLLLDKSLLPANIGWRVAFAIGAVFGLTILLVRRNVPESPRWLFIHGRQEEAGRLVDDIERQVEDSTHQQLSEPDQTITVRQRKTIGFVTIPRQRWGERRVPHCQRDLPDGDPGPRDRLLLRDRHRSGRHHRAAAVRPPGGNWQALRYRLGFLIGAILMVAAGLVEVFLGVDAEGRSLEDIAKPLTAEDAQQPTERGRPDGREPATARG